MEAPTTEAQQQPVSAAAAREAAPPAAAADPPAAAAGQPPATIQHSTAPVAAAELPGAVPAVATDPAAAAAPGIAPPSAAAPAIAPSPAAAQSQSAAPAVPDAAPPAAAPAGAKRPHEEAAAVHAHASPDAKRPHVAAEAPAAAPAAAPAEPAAAPVAGAVPRETVYRLVLDVVDTALIIGRGGNTVRQIEAATGGRVKRLQEPPGARSQVVVIWHSARDLPSPGRVARNTAQEALLECVRRVVFQENAPMGAPMTVRLLAGRTQEAGIRDNAAGIAAEAGGVGIELKRGQDLPACALDNDVLVELTGERYALLAAVEALSHVLREHPVMERPGGAPAALRAAAAAPAPAAAGYAAAPVAYRAA